MSKKVIILPLSIIALGTLAGCGVKQTEETKVSSKYFGDYTNSSYEGYTAIPDDTITYDDSSAILHVESARTRAKEKKDFPTKLNYDFHTGAIMDSAVTNITDSNPSSYLPTGRQYKHISTTKGDYKIYSNNILEDNSFLEDYTTLNDKYRVDYVKETNKSLFFAGKEGDDFGLATINSGSYYDRTSDRYDTLDMLETRTESDVNQYINNKYESYRTDFVNTVFDMYDELTARVKETSGSSLTGKFAKLSNDGNRLYYYFYVSDDTTTANNSLYTLINDGLDDELFPSQITALNNELDTYSANGIKFVINPSNAFDINDIGMVDSVRRDCLSLFNYFIPVYQSHEFLLTLNKIETDGWRLASASSKYSSEMLKNEDGTILDTPLSYKTKYNHASFDYSEKEEHEPLSYDKELNKHSKYYINCSENEGVPSTPLYERSAFAGELPENVHLYEGYLVKGSDASRFGFIPSTYIGGEKKYIGYSNKINTNSSITVSSLDAGPHSQTSSWASNTHQIRWPEGYSEVYVTLYLSSTGAVYDEPGYGLTLDFINGNTAYEG